MILLQEKRKTSACGILFRLNNPFSLALSEVKARLWLFYVIDKYLV